MGYTTQFRGSFTVTPPMSYGLVTEINAFSKERHGGNMKPYEGFPGFWCDWVATSDTTFEWNDGEKFYDYAAWLRLLIDRFLKPNDRTMSGEVEWVGEDAFDDRGTLVVVDNVVTENRKP